jgi:c-di-GMP-binding flagellar brake protein YcgR
VGKFFDNIKSAISGEDPLEQVRAHLRHAQRSRAKVFLHSIDSKEAQPSLITQIEQVEKDAFQITRPAAGGVLHPLAVNERFEMTFMDGRHRYGGETSCLARVRIPSGGSRVLFGYRMSLPNQLIAHERREHARATVGFDLAPKVEISSFSFEGVVRGTMIDVSAGGMQVRTYTAKGRLTLDQQVFVNCALPDPVGELSEVMRIAYLGEGKVEGQVIIGLAFRDRVETIDQFVRRYELQRARRRHA